MNDMEMIFNDMEMTWQPYGTAWLLRSLLSLLLWQAWDIIRISAYFFRPPLEPEPLEPEPEAPPRPRLAAGAGGAASPVMSWGATIGFGTVLGHLQSMQYVHSSSSASAAFKIVLQYLS